VKRVIWRLFGFLTRTTLRIGVLIAVVVLSFTFNVAVLAAGSVREAIVDVLKHADGSNCISKRCLQDAQIRSLEQKNRDLSRRNTGLNGENRNLRQSRDLLDTKLADERVLRRTMTEKGTDITRRMTQRTTRGITANFGSMAAEAVPYVGIAVIIGVTFYEVRDACLTMSDMRELSDMFGTPSDGDNRYCGFTLDEFKNAVFDFGSKVDCSNLNMPPEMVAQCQERPTIDSTSSLVPPTGHIEAPARP
jgi:hypothetical protein